MQNIFQRMCMKCQIWSMLQFALIAAVYYGLLGHMYLVFYSHKQFIHKLLSLKPLQHKEQRHNPLCHLCV